MASLHEFKDPIPQEMLGSLRGVLESLQGNILQGHGRDHSVHIFLRFKDGEGTGAPRSRERIDVKHWIQGLTEHLTSAQQQLDEIEQYRRDKTRGRLFMNFLLSANGYRYLFPEGRLRFNDEAFLYGMKAAQHRLNDPSTHAWETGYQGRIDAMILLADDDKPSLLRQAGRLMNDVKSHAEISAVEHGSVMWNNQEYPVEHFGFVDSNSQPLFFQRDIERARRRGGGTTVWNPGAGPDSVLAPDPYGREGWDSGSYLVFRKLEQNVRGFKEYEQKLAHTLGLSGEDEKRAGALVMGRFEDGTPIALQPMAGHPTNDFTYDQDPPGGRCPFQAHIRKVNPRQPGTPHIVRRGITYGERTKYPWDHPSLEELPSEGVGLLFMCYQRSIAQQFEVLQYLWANDPRIPSGQEPGIDPIIGRPGANGVGQQRWPAQWGAPRQQHKPFDFHGFVRPKGGEYFFAPSLYFLRHLV